MDNTISDGDSVRYWDMSIPGGRLRPGIAILKSGRIFGQIEGIDIPIPVEFLEKGPSKNFFCVLANRQSPFTFDQVRYISIGLNWARKHRLEYVKFYEEATNTLTAFIETQPENLSQIITMDLAYIELVKAKRFEDAFDIYTHTAMSLAEKFWPDCPHPLFEKWKSENRPFIRYGELLKKLGHMERANSAEAIRNLMDHAWALMTLEEQETTQQNSVRKLDIPS